MIKKHYKKRCVKCTVCSLINLNILKTLNFINFCKHLNILLFRRMTQTSPLPQLERPPRPGGRSRGSPPPPGIPASPREGGPTLPRGAGTPQHRSPAMSLVGRVGHLQNNNKNVLYRMREWFQCRHEPRVMISASF